MTNLFVFTEMNPIKTMDDIFYLHELTTIIIIIHANIIIVFSFLFSLISLLMPKMRIRYWTWRLGY